MRVGSGGIAVGQVGEFLSSFNDANYKKCEGGYLTNTNYPKLKLVMTPEKYEKVSLNSAYTVFNVNRRLIMVTLKGDYELDFYELLEGQVVYVGAITGTSLTLPSTMIFRLSNSTYYLYGGKTGKVFTTTNLTTWTESTLTGTTTSAIGLADTADKFYVLGGSLTPCLYSTDGLTFTSVGGSNLPQNPSGYGLSKAGYFFCKSFSTIDNQISVSYNGGPLSASAIGISSAQKYNYLGEVGGLIGITIGSGSLYYTTPDFSGAITQRTFPSPFLDNTKHQDQISFMDGTYVYVPLQNGLYRTSDMINWELVKTWSPNITYSDVKSMLRNDAYLFCGVASGSASSKIVIDRDYGMLIPNFDTGNDTIKRFVKVK